MAATITAQLVEPNGRKFTKIAKADTEAHARALMTAELKLTSGTLLSETIRLDYATPDPVNASTSYSDAEFTFRAGTTFSNVHFEQLANGYQEASGGPFIDTGNADIDAFAVAWSVAHGGGFNLVHAKYVR